MSTIEDPLTDAAEVMRRSRGVVSATSREKQAADMRVMGMSYDAITQQLGFIDIAAVAAIVHEESLKRLGDEVPHMRRLTLLRFDRMLQAVMPFAVGEGKNYFDEDEDEWVGVPTIAAIETVLKIEAARMKLVGGNAPEEMRIGRPVQSGADRVVDDVGRFTTIVDGLVTSRTLADRRHPGEDSTIDVKAIEDGNAKTGDG